MIIKISIIVFSCACFISIYRMLYGLHCGRQVHCGRQQQQGGQEQGGGWTLLDSFGPLLKIWKNRAKGHVSLLPDLVLLVVLVVRSALACQKILKGLDP